MSKVKRSHEQAMSAWRRLRIQWEKTSAQWNDRAREQYEREFWQEYESVVPSALRAMQSLNEIIDQARRYVK